MAKTQESKDAKRLSRTYGVSHQKCLQLIRKLGLEGAIQQIEQWAAPHTTEDSPAPR